MGIDSLLTNGIHRGDIERVWAILGLPQESCYPLIALILGYPKAEPPYRMGRLRGPGVIHFEQYQRANEKQLEEIILPHDDKDRHLALNDDWRGKGHKHYLDWFYKEWVARRGPASGECAMFKRLKKSGFVDGQKA
jgi:hypothetical protein